MDRLSQRIANWLSASGAISPKEHDLFYFAVYSFLLSVTPLLISLFLGCMFGIGIDSLLMILPFICIRKFSGGFHFKSANLCFFLTIILLGGCLLFVKYSPLLGDLIYLDGIVLLSAMEIFTCSPIDSKERALTNSESMHFKRISRYMVAAFSSLYFALSWGMASQYAVPLGVGITIVALLQLPCIFLRLWKLPQRI